jgi:cysteine synthase A
MRKRDQQGSILSLLCDSGERYLGSYFSEPWVAEHIGDCAPALQQLKQQLDCQA